MNIKILQALLYRHNTYKWEVFLSRHEFVKFGLTEWGMRKELRKLRRVWLLTVWKRYYEANKYSNVYNLSKELLEHIKQALRDVKPSFDIVKYNASVKLEEIKDMFWIKRFGKNIILSNNKGEYKYTFNSEYNIITKWDKWWGWGNKWMNCFNWLKELFGINTKELISIVN